MKTSVALLMPLMLLFTSVAFAKRSAPARVAPVKAGAIEYRVSHNQMGSIEAWDATGSELIWRRQIYVVKYQVGLERDIQDVFITTVELAGDHLLVKNERGSDYQLDLGTLAVKVLKGNLVETTKIK